MFSGPKRTNMFGLVSLICLKKQKTPRFLQLNSYCKSNNFRGFADPNEKIKKRVYLICLSFSEQAKKSPRFMLLNSYCKQKSDVVRSQTKKNDCWLGFLNLPCVFKRNTKILPDFCYWILIAKVIISEMFRSQTKKQMFGRVSSICFSFSEKNANPTLISAVEFLF